VEGSGCGLILTNYPSFRLEGLMKTARNLSHDSRSPRTDMNAGPSKYEAGMLATRPADRLYLKITAFVKTLLLINGE
jgi:hypothetical protein